MNYEEFLQSKEFKFSSAGFQVDISNLNSKLFDFQKDIDKWSLKKGMSAIFADCGLGKSAMQLEWAKQVSEHTKGNVLILAPLAVSKQTKREGEKFGINVNIVTSQDEVKPGINITNYEKLHKFNANEFSGIVLDESSILKSFTGKIRTEIIETFKNTSYKLACTATPAPNDFMELGNHAEFLNVMNRNEMLATFFVHDGGDTSQWRLKGHAQDEFWKWVGSWATVIKKPSDLGYDDGNFKLPELNIQEIIVKNDEEFNTLIPMVAQTLEERRAARKSSMMNRINAAADLVNTSNEQWLVWCDYNDESKYLSKSINNAVEVTGSDSDDHKTDSMLNFSDGKIKALVTKPKIAGYGMNWQNCHNIIFCGLSDSYEQFYQAVRRCWRFGQKEKVNVYVIIGQREISVLNNIKKKQKYADTMAENMINYTKDILNEEIINTSKDTVVYKPEKIILPSWLTKEAAI